MSSDIPFHNLDPLPDGTVEALHEPIGQILAVLPAVPDGVWYRFRFDVCFLKSGVQVVHARYYAMRTPS
jgi:hypothetical protein